MFFVNFQVQHHSDYNDLIHQLNEFIQNRLRIEREAKWLRITFRKLIICYQFFKFVMICVAFEFRDCVYYENNNMLHQANCNDIENWIFFIAFKQKVVIFGYIIDRYLNVELETLWNRTFDVKSPKAVFQLHRWLDSGLVWCIKSCYTKNITSNAI